METFGRSPRCWVQRLNARAAADPDSNCRRVMLDFKSHSKKMLRPWIADCARAVSATSCTFRYTSF